MAPGTRAKSAGLSGQPAPPSASTSRLQSNLWLLKRAFECALGETGGMVWFMAGSLVRGWRGGTRTRLILQSRDTDGPNHPVVLTEHSYLTPPSSDVRRAMSRPRGGFLSPG